MQTAQQGRSVRLLAAATLAALLGASAIHAECTSTSYSPNSARPGETIGLLPAADLPDGLVEGAVALWRRCANYGVGFPALVRGRGQARTVTIAYRPHSRSSICGRFRGQRIELFAFALDERGEPFHCGSRSLILAHEIGHVLGLADAPATAECRHHVMSGLDRGNRHDREVRDEECQAASQRWLTRRERRFAASGARGASE